MPKTHPPYSPEFRRHIVDLVRAGRDPADLARELIPMTASARFKRSARRAILFLEKGHLGRKRVGFGDLWAAFGRGQCAEGTCVALPVPVGQRRGVEALAAQDDGDAAGVGRAIRVGENAHLVLGGADAR